MTNTVQTNKGEPVRLLVFSVSQRKDSYNTKLAKLVAEVIERHGGVVDYATMQEFDAPSFNQDLEVDDFHPEGTAEFRKRLLANDAFVIACPEYNGSMPGLIKNAIDWVSRYRPQPFNGKHALLLSASPSMIGGNRSLWQLRVPLENLGTHVFPHMFSLATAHQAFDEADGIANDALRKRLEDNVV